MPTDVSNVCLSGKTRSGWRTVKTTRFDPQETLAGSKSRNARLRAPIWDMLPGRNPAAVADALVTLLLAHVIVHNAHDPATMAARHSQSRSIRTTPT